MEGGMCLVERDGAAFYAPMDQASAWGEQGYAVYAVQTVPLNDVARVAGGGAAPARSVARRPKGPREEEIV